MNGHSGYLFRSEIQANNYIQLDINEAENIKNLCDEKYFPFGKTILRLKMSPAQFSELITTLNYSSGVPCTLEVVNSEDIPQVKLNELENRKSFVNRKLQERMTKFANTLKDGQIKAKKLIAKKTLSKDDQHELNRLIEFMSQEIQCNIPFFAKCFQETMDDIVVDAKAEIDATIQSFITNAGLKTLGLNPPNISKQLQ